MNALHPDHLADLQKSGLSDESIEKVGIHSVVDPEAIKGILGWVPPKTTLLVFPYPGDGGFTRYKLFPPIQDKDGKKHKYHQPPGSGLRLYQPQGFDLDGEVILITEGEKKALKASQEGLNCMAMGGIWNYAIKDVNGKPRLIDDFDLIEWIDRKVELVPDSDFQKKKEVKHAVYRLGTLLEQRGAEVRVVCLPVSDDEGKLDDYLCQHSVEEFKNLKRIKLTHKLFKDVKKLEDKKPEESSVEINSIVEDIEPWGTPVNGTELLNKLHDVIGRHVVLDASARAACTLWTVLTYCYDSFRILPMLAITSPEKRCGKTTLLEMLAGLANKPLLASSITPSAVFRTIEKHTPCLLIDEADTFLKDNEELRGILNSGHTRRSAFVIRTNPTTLEVEKFSTWGPKAVSLIGTLPDTLQDRSFSVRMQRKTPSEAVERVTLDFDSQHLTLRRKLKRWAVDNAETLKSITPTIPKTSNDRATDNWLPLLTIAALVGGGWPDEARKAMEAIERVSDEDTIKQILLRDVKGIFDGQEKISSKELVEELIKIEDHPWGDWRKGRPITQNGLARLLKPFGILSKTIRTGVETAKGYTLEQFIETFERYLPPTPPLQSVTTSQPTPVKGLRDFQSVTQTNDVTVVNHGKPTPAKECDVATVENPLKGGMNEKGEESYVDF